MSEPMTPETWEHLAHMIANPYIPEIHGDLDDDAGKDTASSVESTRAEQPLTAEQEHDIRTRLTAASHGPWSLSYERCCCTEDDECGYYVSRLDTGAGPATELRDLPAEDWELMAHAPTDIRALLAEVDRLRAALDEAHENLIGANLSCWEEEQDTARLRLALASAQRGRRELRAHVAELEADCRRWADGMASAEKVRQLHAADADRYEAELRAENARLRAELAARPSRAEVLQEAETAVTEGDLGPSGGMTEDYENGWWNSRHAAAERVRHLAEASEQAVPRTERSYWVDIAAVLNAALAAGMPVGIDLDGTLTDHNAWSVVWDRNAERWTVAGYEDDAAEAGEGR